MCRNTKNVAVRESVIPVIAEKFAKGNWPLATLLCCQSKKRVFKMKALTTLLCIIILHHSIALLGKKYKRIMIDGSTWNSMQIGSHSDSESRGLVIRVNFFFVKYYKILEFSALKQSTVDLCAQLMPTAMPTIMNPRIATRPVLQG